MVEKTGNIRFTHSVLEDIRLALDKSAYSKVFVLVDENTNTHCFPVILNSLPENYHLIKIPSGEGNKNLSTCQYIWQELTNQRADRHALLINLGGGVICDMGGFCARTYKRGISFWNIPTTVLSQVDASVGGKLGVDFGQFKNHIGLFSEPDMVFIDSVFLGTLPQREVLSGFAEMVKHTLIRDKEGFENIRQLDLTKIDWSIWIPRSVEIKKAVVEEDPSENDIRKVLNYGHTIGHAIESYYLDSSEPFKHGEAIAIGMVCETYLSKKKCGLPATAAQTITEFLLKTFPSKIIASNSIKEIVALAAQDKKNKDGIINAVLLKEIGEPLIDVALTNADIQNALEDYNQSVK